jgi:3-hydroxybutyryl-CoA dehydratase
MNSPIKTGTELRGFKRVVTQDRVAAYAYASGDHNPIHLDESFASTTRFGQRIAHGMLSLAFVWEMVSLNYPSTWQRGGTVKTRFTSPVIPGEEVSVSGSVKRMRMVGNREFVECDVSVTRPGGEKALTGSALIPLA